MGLSQVIGVYDIDLSNDTSFCKIKAPWSDGNVRYLHFALYSNGERYILPNDSDVTVQLEGINGNYKNVQMDVHIDNTLNVIVVPLIGSINDVAGAGVYRIVMTEVPENGYSGEDTPVTLATFNFDIFIVKQNFDVNAAIESVEYDALLKAIANANGWKHGDGEPTDATEAKINDLYLDTSSGTVYVLTANGWEEVMTIKGGGIEYITVQYALSSSSTTHPESGWSNDYPSTIPDATPYVWIKQTIKTTGEGASTYYSYSVSYVGTTAEAFGAGTRNGNDVVEGDDAYHNNAKYYSEVASEEASDSYESSLDSEAWAIGTREGTLIDQDDPAYDKYAKYWAMSASADAQIAISKAEEADTSAATAATKATEASTSATTATTQAGIATTAATTAASKASDSEAWAVGQRDGEDVPDTDDTYHNNAKYYADFVKTATEEHLPEFTVNWETGMLEYTGGYFTFWIDDDGILRWGVESTI